MNKILMSTAAACLLALSGAAFAQTTPPAAPLAPNLANLSKKDLGFVEGCDNAKQQAGYPIPWAAGPRMPTDAEYNTGWKSGYDFCMLAAQQNPYRSIPTGPLNPEIPAR